jgi:hypothetical protein
MIRSRAIASRAPAAPHAGAARPLTRPPARRTRQLSGDREQTQASLNQGDHDRKYPESNACGHRQMQVRRISRHGPDQRSSRSATGVPERERPDRRLGALPLTTSRPWSAGPIDQFCSLCRRSSPRGVPQADPPPDRRRRRLGDPRRGSAMTPRGLLPLRHKRSRRRGSGSRPSRVVRRRLLRRRPRRSGQRAPGAGISRLQKPLSPTSLSVIDRDARAYAQGGTSAACLLLLLLVILASSDVNEIRCFLAVRLVVSPSVSSGAGASKMRVASFGRGAACSGGVRCPGARAWCARACCGWIPRRRRVCARSGGRGRGGQVTVAEGGVGAGARRRDAGVAWAGGVGGRAGAVSRCGGGAGGRAA